MVQATIRVEESRSTIQTSAGVQSVMISGILQTVMSSAVSWVSLERLRRGVKLILVKEVVPSFWMMFGAMVMKHTFWIALMVDGMNITVSIRKMQVWIVTNSTMSQECILG